MSKLTTARALKAAASKAKAAPLADATARHARGVGSKKARGSASLAGEIAGGGASLAGGGDAGGVGAGSSSAVASHADAPSSSLTASLSWMVRMREKESAERNSPDWDPEFDRCSLPGSPEPLYHKNPLLQYPYIVKLADFAVKENNRKKGKNMELVKVLDVLPELVCGFMYYLTISVKDGSKLEIYRARVWDDAGACKEPSYVLDYFKKDGGLHPVE